MSNRPRAVDFLDDNENEDRSERSNLSEEEPVYVEFEANDSETEANETHESEPETIESVNVATLPSGAISKGTAAFLIYILYLIIL